MISKKIISTLLIITTFLSLTTSAFAASQNVVTLGGNLSASQKSEMLKYFGVDENSSTNDLKVLTITNAEERSQLAGLVSDSAIGTKSISCVYLKITESGSGINVSTNNITVVTKQAYANALLTAGVKDADITAAAPFPVSGTAALTGVFKAYEEATGEPIPENSKKVATEELATTSDLGEQTGNPEGVSDLMQQLKEEVIEKGISDPSEIKELIEEKAKENGINLSQDQIDKIADILTKIKGLNIDLSSLKQQLNQYLDSSVVQNLWQQIKQAVTGLWDKIIAAI